LLPASLLRPSKKQSEEKDAPTREKRSLDASGNKASTNSAAASPRAGTKQALVMEMLCGKKGATLDALIGATGWLPHTTRAALTGLRRRGFSIERTREEGSDSIYCNCCLRASTRRLTLAPSRSPAAQPASAPAEPLDAVLARIAEMNIEQLRGCWRETFASDPPAAFSKDLLARAICYRLQEQAFGGLSASTGRQLRSLAKPDAEPPRRIKVGSVLVREHQGLVHEVLVVPGGFCWQGKTHGSLSTIAKMITGTSWNGPRFFGLRSRKISDHAEDLTTSQALLDRKPQPSSSRKEAAGRPGRRSSMRAGAPGDAGGGQ
jgi:hypothetical protein